MLPSNKIIALVGENGAGKTTTLKLMMGLLKKTHGNIIVKGKTPNSFSLNNDIGFLPERIEFPDFFTSNDIIYNLSKIRRVNNKGMKKIEEYIEYFKLNGMLNKAYASLSKGNTQKIGIIQAILHDPELLILDEPTSGLDPMARKRLFDLIFNLKNEGKTIIVSSHNLQDMQKSADIILFFKDGTLAKMFNVKEEMKNSMHIKAYFENVITNKDIEKIKQSIIGVTKVTSSYMIIQNNTFSNINELIHKLDCIDIKVLRINSESTLLEDYYLKLFDEN